MFIAVVLVFQLLPLRVAESTLLVYLCEPSILIVEI